MKDKNKAYRDKMVKHYSLYPDMKLITYKGAILYFVFSIFATVIVPDFLISLGLDAKFSIVLCSTVIGGLGVAIVRSFVETNKGFGRGFIALACIFGFAFFVISYYWTYYNYFI